MHRSIPSKRANGGVDFAFSRVLRARIGEVGSHNDGGSWLFMTRRNEREMDQLGRSTSGGGGGGQERSGKTRSRRSGVLEGAWRLEEQGAVGGGARRGPPS